ncbi:MULTISPECIES: WXG100 family type VII secretion target [Streptomyces]|uniref:ESAT-6-like protein n=1 Tax=Streptomyces viridochromogenes TaxID=1938 RepID=A0A0L8JD73_STRVR|nr:MULTISPECIES: WXG100 family type VII secretion target [Streptomyces]KOG11612.1 hypothetical protein ADK34_33935 [Streptomyces viridochromogenes]
MPTSGYSYSTDDVRNGASILLSNHAAFLDEINSLENQVLQSTSGWQGASGDAFRLTIQNIRKHLDETARGIEMTSQHLSALADDVEEEDSATAGRFQQLG